MKYQNLKMFAEYTTLQAQQTPIIIAKFKERNELSKFVKSLAVHSKCGKYTITHVVLNTAKEDFQIIIGKKK